MAKIAPLVRSAMEFAPNRAFRALMTPTDIPSASVTAYWGDIMGSSTSGAGDHATARRPGPWDLEEHLLEVLSHPRYGGGYMPVWRIADAGALPLHPVAIHWSLKRLEREGRVEHRRLATGQIEWRTLVGSVGS